MNVNEAIEYIHSVYWKGGHFGLDRIVALLEKMGNPEKKLKYVHIAGTNGKGSTASMTASILQKAGYRTGLYTSPYIYRFHERIQIDGEQISDEDLVEITEMVKPLADAMEERPTEFELVCCIAFEYFARKQCDIVVLEVGLGGDYDAQCGAGFRGSLPGKAYCAEEGGFRQPEAESPQPGRPGL